MKDGLALVEWRNSYNNQRCAPGPVGSVGDVIGSVRFKHSSPDAPLRFDPYFIASRLKVIGSQISDGDHANYVSGGYGARTLDTRWTPNRSFKTNIGWYMQDLRPADKLVEPYVGTTLDYSWRNKIATTYDVKRTGSKFLPLPGGYQLAPGEEPRGATPRVTNVEPGDYVQNIIDAPYTQGGNAYFQNVLGRSGNGTSAIGNAAPPTAIGKPQTVVQAPAVGALSHSSITKAQMDAIAAAQGDTSGGYDNSTQTVNYSGRGG